jgi:alcohol dehydrogenase
MIAAASAMTNPPSPTKILFGPGTFGQLRAELEALGSSRPFVVCGRHFEASLHGRSLHTALPGAEFFIGVEENPLMSTVDAQARIIRDQGCDAVVGIGGGSVLDAAKVAACLGTTLSCAAFVAAPQAEKTLPYVTVPTTSGSGSEVTRAAVLTDAKGLKVAVANDILYPRTAIVDPELTYALPARITASSGIDALCQGVESFWAATANAESEHVALEAATAAYANLERAVHTPDAASRKAMSVAALRSGQALSMTGLTGCHGVSYGFSKCCGLVHGFAVALTLPWFLEFYNVVQPEKCSHICKLLGSSDIAHAQDEFRRLLKAIGAPVTLSEAHCTPGHIPELISLGLGKRPASPRQLTAEDMQALLESLSA